MKKQQKTKCYIAETKLDVAYLTLIEATLSEWNSEPDEEAYLFTD